jgi:hypothetical protein
LTNLDYLDFWMRSIHSHTANMPDISNDNQTNKENEYIDVFVDENHSIRFRYAALSPPISN